MMLRTMHSAALWATESFLVVLTKRFTVKPLALVWNLWMRTSNKMRWLHWEEPQVDILFGAKKHDLHTRRFKVNFTSHWEFSVGAVQLSCRQWKTGLFIAGFNLSDLLAQRNRLPDTPSEPRLYQPALSYAY